MHIPSHSPGKGTSVVRQTIKNIINEYPFVKYTELSGLSNSEVLSRLTDADLLIDQVYSDLPLSGVGMEAFVMGVPVLVCGYGLLDLKRRYSSKFFLLIVISHPHKLKESLRMLINKPEILNDAKASSTNFVETVWSKEEVAKRYYQLFTCDNLPEDWWHDPMSHVYFYGYGLSDVKIKSILKDVLQSYGLNGLCLSHRPDLKDAISNFVSENI